MSVARERVNKCRVYRAPAAGCQPGRARAAGGAPVWPSSGPSALDLPSVRIPRSGRWAWGAVVGSCPWLGGREWDCDGTLVPRSV